MRNGRLEDEGFYVRLGEFQEIQKAAWEGCPVTLRVQYLRLKIQNHHRRPTAFTTYMTEVLQLDEVKNAEPAEQEVIPDKLLYGATATPMLEYTRFIEPYATHHSSEHGNGQPFDPKLSFDTLLAAGAVLRGDEEEFTRIFDNDGDISEECGRFFVVPLYVLAMYGSLSMARVVARKSVIFRNNPKVSVSPLLHLSVAKGNKELVNVWMPILRAKLEIDFLDEMEAALVGPHGFVNPDMVVFVLQRCLMTDHCLYYMLLGTAVEYGHVDIVDFILQYEYFDASDAEFHCWSLPLELAKDIEDRDDRKHMIEMLVGAGFDAEVLVRRVEGRRVVLVSTSESDDLDDDDHEDSDGEESEDDMEWEELEAVLRPDIEFRDDEWHLTVRMSELKF